MLWSLTEPAATPPAGEMPKTLEEAARRVTLLSRLQDLVAWGRKNSMWPFNFGLSCCYVEMATSLTSPFDLARFGAEVIRATPREADVIVCEGLLGNAVLKLVEGLAEVFANATKAAAQHRLRWRAGLVLLGEALKQVGELTDYSRYGGAPILGFENMFIKCHGRSSAHAIRNAVKVAAKAVRDNVPSEIAEAVVGIR